MAIDSREYKPDTITVTAMAEEYVAATGADIAVVIRGGSLFTGAAALKKAREVAALVAELATVGVSEDSVELRGVHAEVVTGSLGAKSSTAVYSLHIKKIALEQIADVIGVITNQKNTTLHGLDWGYGDEEAMQLRLLEAALRQARAKANTAATALGIALRGVHSLSETFTDEEGKTIRDRDASLNQELSYGRARARRVDAEELGMSVTHSKRVVQTVQLIYRVAEITN